MTHERREAARKLKFLTYTLGIAMVALGGAILCAGEFYWPGDQPAVNCFAGVLIGTGLVAVWEGWR